MFQIVISYSPPFDCYKFLPLKACFVVIHLEHKPINIKPYTCIEMKQYNFALDWY